MKNKAKNILIADDHNLMREGLKTCLQKHPEYIITGEAINGEEAVLKAHQLIPDIVLMDLRMPKKDGLTATREILSALPNIKIIVISALKDEEYITEALKSGAKGYVLKDSVTDNLIQAIETVCNDEIFLDKKVSQLLLNDYIKKIAESSWTKNV